MLCGYNVDMVRLEHVLDSWKAVRQDTIAAIEEFPAEDLDFRAAPGVATFREIAHHILNASDGLSGLLLSGWERFNAPDFRERMKPYIRPLPATPGAQELAQALRESIEQRTAELASRPPEFFAHIITRVDGQRVTRLEMLQFIKEHELTHRAQMFMCMRLKGMVPATTRRRLARQAAQ